MDKKYLIIGCARSGIATAKFLLSKGEKVVLTDNNNKDKILSSFPEVESWSKDENIELIFGRQPDEEVIYRIKEIIMSPGVPLNIPIIKKAKDLKINMISEIELAYRYSKAPMIAITGTNGKTTTTTLTGEMFKNSGKKTYVVGNIGDPIINYVDIAGSEDIFVAEISSFQLETIQDFKPHLSALLNITPDHLDRHKTMENYIHTKGKIFQNLTESDFCLINADDPILSDMKVNSDCNKIYFSVDKIIKRGSFLVDNTIKIIDGEKIFPVCSIDDLKIPGIHNVKNALAATALAYFGGVSIPVIQKTLKSFPGVEHRLEMVRVFHGVTYINDSKGTNTDASTIAIQAVKAPIILIAGGYDKDSAFEQWMDSFDEKVKYLIVLGATADKIIETARVKNFEQITKVSSLEEAVSVAFKMAQEGDTVLLSPACASWDMFRDFEERGTLFKKMINKLGGK
ncbi:MAG: UDP-N-acetylmuramoyl-L-alanine--D-glutamate ligase [Eubacteriales bacterium]